MIIFLVAMVFATQLARLAPLALGGVAIPKEFERWLTHVPIAILTSLVLPEFFETHSVDAASAWNFLFVCAGVVCLIVGAASKNLLLTTFVGIAFVGCARAFFLV